MIVSNKQIMKRPHRMPCIGDLNKRIKLHVRKLKAPSFGETNFTEDFAGVEVWGSIKTVSGQTLFTGANVDVAITHQITIRYNKDVTMETWIEFENNRYDIIDVEDYEERHEFMRLRCVNRGDKDLEASKA